MDGKGAFARHCEVAGEDAMRESYRDDLGAALAQLDALRPHTKAPAELPSKDSLFEHLRELFVSSPERWTRVSVGWVGWDNVYHRDCRDGWVLDFKAGERVFGFYRTGFFGIRVGFLGCGDPGRAERVDSREWVYIFCPRFRRTVRKRRNWRLLRDLEGK